MACQFSIRSLSILLVLVTVALGAMVSHNRWAAVAVYTLIWFLLCLAAVAALVTSDDRQRFWIGAAIFGWCYWFFVVNATNEIPAVMSRRAIPFYYGAPGYGPAKDEERFLTNRLLDYLQSKLATRWSVGDDVYAQWGGGGFFPGVVDEIKDGQYLIRWTDGSASPSQWTAPGQIAGNSGNMRIAGQSLFCLLFAVLGGSVGQQLGALAAHKPKPG